MKSIKQLEGQQNFLQQGFERTKCIFINLPCTHYWASRTKEECGDGFCMNKCCKKCKEKFCGYKCNASGYIKDE